MKLTDIILSEKVKVVQLYLTLYSLWSSPGHYMGEGGCSLLQGISPTQGSNPGLPHVQADSLPAEPPGKPKWKRAISKKKKKNQTHKYCVIPFIRDTQSCQIHRDKVEWSLPNAMGRGG